ncbi:hypothetical protein CBR_g49018 [Chara braunii]|uniref:DUF659 domain-containing protein n=1 Tax=Chara braunii TaxID=69332 RepID=A0A388M3Z2_CHABU|nr:hypothetical protein CBR_g49018 [Chara braunii]|eukprot:GBG89308.1 hypothetical protein CBR_g49018 [Chara braunii]
MDREYVAAAARHRLGFHLYEHGVPFNYVTGEKTQELHDLYLEPGEKKQRVKMPNRMQMATVVLDITYEKTREEMRPLMNTWDNSGCTLITNGCTDRKFRPVMNFIAAGESGVFLLKVVDMSKRKKTAIALAKLWEGVIREIGVHRVNALCTDNAEVNKQAARLLRRRTDSRIARIPWVSCAMHCLNMPLKGISEEPWANDLYKRAKTVVKCIKNHHKTVSLFLGCAKMERTRTLIMPIEVRFTSVYLMLHRLLDRKKVLKNMMGRDSDILPDDAQPSSEEVARRERLRKASQGRIPVVGRVDDDSDIDSSDDGEDLVWRGKGKKRKDLVPNDPKGKGQVVEEDYEEEKEMEDKDDETVYGIRPKGDSDEDSDDDDNGDTEDPVTMRQQTYQLDSDIDFLMPREAAHRGGYMVDEVDAAARAAAQALAKRGTRGANNTSGVGTGNRSGNSSSSGYNGNNNNNYNNNNGNCAGTSGSNVGTNSSARSSKVGTNNSNAGTSSSSPGTGSNSPGTSSSTSSGPGTSNNVGTSSSPSRNNVGSSTSASSSNVGTSANTGRSDADTTDSNSTSNTNAATISGGTTSGALL